MAQLLLVSNEVAQGTPAERSLPVLALLFLNLRLSRRLRYPHDLLAAEERRGLASFLFRNLRTYYDVLLDALIALVLASFGDGPQVAVLAIGGGATDGDEPAPAPLPLPVSRVTVAKLTGRPVTGSRMRKKSRWTSMALPVSRS